MNKYLGHPMQMYGIEEIRLVGGKADGMRMLSVRNGKAVFDAAQSQDGMPIFLYRAFAVDNTNELIYNGVKALTEKNKKG